MSEDKQRVSLDMLETRLKDAETDLVTAIRRRAVASEHLRTAMIGNGNPTAMTILANLERIMRQSATTNHNELLLRWGVEFQVDLIATGLERIMVTGPEQMRIWDQSRGLFGHQLPMTFESDPRETLTAIADSDNTVGVMGWVAIAGSGQWWPVLNESRYHNLRIIGAWPVLGNQSPNIAIVAKGPVTEHAGCRTLFIAHDDHHKVSKIFGELGLKVSEFARARTLVLFETPVSISENDPRLKTARAAGLDGLRVVGSLPGQKFAANDDNKS